MKYRIDHDLHIHSQLSSCSRDAEQNTDRILRYAKENKLHTIAITDHFWDAEVDGASSWYSTQDLAHVRKALPLPKEDGIRFLFGCEGEMDGRLVVGLSEKNYESFEFIIIPTTHLHMSGFVLPSDFCDSNENRARLWVRRLEALLGKSLPFKKLGIAHLACPLTDNRSRADYLRTLSLIPTEEMERLFCKAAKLGCGIELNRSDMSFADEEADTVLRMFRIAKVCGCKFYLGSDAHHPASLDSSVPVFERAIGLLGLTESDKFIPE